MSYELKWGDSGVQLSFKDELDYYLIYRAHNEIYGNSRFEDLKFIIVNLLEVKDIKISQNQLLMISTIDKGACRWNQHLKFSMILNEEKSNLRKAVSGYFDLMNGGQWKIKLFNCLEKSFEWSKKE